MLFCGCLVCDCASIAVPAVVYKAFAAGNTTMAIKQLARATLKVDSPVALALHAATRWQMLLLLILLSLSLLLLLLLLLVLLLWL